MFNELKTTQIAGYLLFMADESMPDRKLLQLMYLADREEYDNYGSSITGDDVIATEKGIILSNTYDLINGYKSEINKWSDLIITNEENNTVSLNRPLSPNDFTKMCEAYIKTLDKIFKQFGHLNLWILTNYI